MNHLPTETELLRVMRRYPEAEEALSRLALKCPEEVIARDLGRYCGGRPEDVERLRKAAKHLQECLSNFSQRFFEAAEMVNKSYPWLELFGYRMHVRAFEDLPKTLTSYAKLLAVLHRSAKRGTSMRTGRTVHLVYLALLIQKLTGKPHYADLASLVGACQMEYGSSRKEVPSPKSIKRIVSHFRKRNEMAMLMLGVEQEVDEIRARHEALRQRS